MTVELPIPISTSIGEIAFTIGFTLMYSALVIGLWQTFLYYKNRNDMQSALFYMRQGIWNFGTRQMILEAYFNFFLSLCVAVNAAFCVRSMPRLYQLFNSKGTILIDIGVENIIKHGQFFATLEGDNLLSQKKIFWLLYCIFEGGLSSRIFTLNSLGTKLSVHMTFILTQWLLIMCFLSTASQYVSWSRSVSRFEFLLQFSSMGGMLFPPTTNVGSLFFTINNYGGLIVYPISFMIYVQQLQLAATDLRDYCPVAQSVPLLSTSMSILNRIVILVVDFCDKRQTPAVPVALKAFTK